MTDPREDPQVEVPLEDLAEQRTALIRDRDGADGDPEGVGAGDDVARATGGPGPLPAEADEGDVVEQYLDVAGDDEDYPRDA